MLWGWLIYSKGTHIHTQSHKSSTHFQQYFDSLPRSGTISREVTQIYKFHYLVFWGFLFLFFPYLYNMPAVPRKQINTWNYFLGGTIQVQIQQGIAPNHKTNDNTSLTKKTFCIHMIGGLKINIINHPPKNSRMPDIPLVYPKFKKHWNVNCVVLRCCETKKNLAFSLFFAERWGERNKWGGDKSKFRAHKHAEAFKRGTRDCVFAPLQNMSSVSAFARVHVWEIYTRIDVGQKKIK